MIPQQVLSDALKEKIAKRRVRAAVFTTYTFDPGFFELHVLPLLFDAPFSQIEKVKRLRLEDELRTIEDVAVYYDRTALSQDATPPQLDFRRIDVRRSTGVFHPKLILVLVENLEDEADREAEYSRGPLSLIVGTLSANLTRAGWWENVETGHFEEIPAVDRDDGVCPFRPDVLALIQRMKSLAPPNEDHSALDRIHEFLRHDTSTARSVTHRSMGKYRTRLYVGQAALPDWLEELRLAGWDWNLEVISPYFDEANAGTLEALVEVLEPKETRVFLPVDADGSAEVTDGLYDGISEIADWSELPRSIVASGAREQLKNAPPRRVHAKVYRMWRKGGPDVVLSGSVNLTAPAHSHGAAGNFEAAFLVDITDMRAGGWWLKPIDYEPQSFAERRVREDEESTEVFVDISLRYDWQTGQLAYRIEGDRTEALRVREPGGRSLFAIEHPRRSRWIDLPTDAASAVGELLPSTSFLEVVAKKGSWRVLVREEGMAHKPSILSSLTPEEILLYWSLLSPAQREAFIIEKLGDELDAEGLKIPKGDRYATGDTVFDRFAGVYHAFEMLARHVADAIERGEDRDAEARLFGKKYDSLPVLLERTLERVEGDPVMQYVTFLSAKQVRDRIRRSNADFWRAHGLGAAALDELLDKLPDVRSRLQMEGKDAPVFLEWYERMFLRTAAMPEVAS